MFSFGTMMMARSAASAARAMQMSTVANVKLLIGGKMQDSSANEWIDVVNPATQQVVSRGEIATIVYFILLFLTFPYFVLYFFS